MDSIVAQRAPLLFILSGPSGAGKDTVINLLRAEVAHLEFAVTATTRPPRPREVPDKSYFFVTPSEYDAMQDAGELIAPANVHGHRYGAPLAELRAAFARGNDALLKIDVQGAMAVRRRFPQAVFIFLAPPTVSTLLDRLRLRHTESPEELEVRTRDAHFELAQMPHYDYCVINGEDGSQHAVQSISCIVAAERLRIQRQPIIL